MAGVKQALTARGVDSKDVSSKKWSGTLAPPQPAVFTFDENKFERLDEQLARARLQRQVARGGEEDLKEFTEIAEAVEKPPKLEDLNKQKIRRPAQGRSLSEGGPAGSQVGRPGGSNVALRRPGAESSRREAGSGRAGQRKIGPERGQHRQQRRH